MTALFAFSAMTQVAAAATVLTFDTLPVGDLVPDIYTEKGVTVSGNPSSYDRAGVVHMDDAGTFFSSLISISTGGLFSALAVDVLGLQQESYLETEDGLVPAAHDNVWFRGYVGGNLVSEFGYSSGFDGFDAQVRFGPSFGSLDLFTISAETRLASGVICLDAPCGHFELDNLIVGTVGETLAPVPLPAAGWLLLAGVGAMGVLRHRRSPV